MGEPALEEFMGEIAAFLSAEGTDGNEPGIRHRPHGGGYAFAAGFATDGEVAQAWRRTLKHGRSIGEDTANIFHRFRVGRD